jgi:beta-alanine--pyruvate transaminase
VIDIRNHGLVGAVELAPRPGAPGARAFEAYLKCYEKGVLVRQTADIIAIAPALIVEDAQIDQIVSTLREVLTALD